MVPQISEFQRANPEILRSVVNIFFSIISKTSRKFSNDHQRPSKFTKFWLASLSGNLVGIVTFHYIFNFCDIIKKSSTVT